ncbi:NADH-quinone oxidoreductase subunit H [Hyphobacterium sp. CCMP332]|nr:NADH-quinone oxidoreductase subunit H [Hyphobacterium sp. CCMP332]
MIALIIILLLIPLFALAAVYLERKISAFIQDRMGPNKTGPYGLLQTLADILKLLQKENIVPTSSDRVLFLIAPLFVFAAILTGYATLPLSPTLLAAPISTGVLFLMGIVSLDIIGLIMAGWGSNNKYSMLGAMRTVAQIISYEIPLGISILTVIMISGTFDLAEIALQQGNNTEYSNPLFGISAIDVNINAVGGFLAWNIFRMPVLLFAFVIFFIASLAECNRAPFDLPEGESELIGGFHTEYGGFRFALLFLSEYGMMLLVSILAVILFLGAWHSPLPNIGSLKLAEWSNGKAGSLGGNLLGIFWLFSKTMLLILLQMIIRWTYPRLRIDQMMSLSWKYLTPAALVIVFIVGLWKIAI